MSQWPPWVGTTAFDKLSPQERIARIAQESTGWADHVVHPDCEACKRRRRRLDGWCRELQKAWVEMAASKEPPK